MYMLSWYSTKFLDKMKSCSIVLTKGNHVALIFLIRYISWALSAMINHHCQIFIYLGIIIFFPKITFQKIK